MIRRLFATVAIVSAVALAGCSSGGGAQPTTTPVILEIGGVAGVAGDALTYLRTAPPRVSKFSGCNTRMLPVWSRLLPTGRMRRYSSMQT